MPTDPPSPDVRAEPPTDTRSLMAAVAALEALVPELEMRGQPRLDVEGRRWPALRRVLQRAVFRVMRPYWFQQNQFNAAMIGALRSSITLLSAEIAARLDAATAAQHQTAARLDTSLTTLTALSASAASADEMRAVANETRETRASTIELDATTRELRASLADVSASVGALGASMTESLTASTASTMTSMAALTDAVSAALAADRAHTQASLAALQDRLRVLSLFQEGLLLVAHGAGRDVGYGRLNGAHGLVTAGGEGNGRRPTPHDEPLFQTRRRLYLPLLERRTPVLEIGCGNGRMLDLLRVAQLPAFGIESNPQLVWHCRANGHTVEETDALHFLRARPRAEDAVGAIFSARLYDDVGMDRFQELIRLCRQRLAADGVLIAEMTASGDDFLRRPESVLALCRRAGFEEARVLFHAGAGDASRDDGPGRYAVAAAVESL